MADLFNTIPVRARHTLSGVQKTVAARLAERLHSTASVTAMAEGPTQGLLAAQAGQRAKGVDASLTHLLIWAIARCLERHPRLNSVIENDTVIEFAEINIALALSMPNGDLQAIVVPHANEKNVSEIAAETQERIELARTGKLTLRHVRGGTFTLSNYGGLKHTVWATPIISPGQSGVLGVGRIRLAPVADDSVAGWHMEKIIPLSLTYDHRLINGVPAGQFLDDLSAMLLSDFGEHT